MKRTAVSSACRPLLESLETRSLFSGTVTVANLNDSGAGSLRQAIADASAGDTVNFASGLSGTITLASTLSIGKDLTIAGPGSADLTISGNGHQMLAVRIAGGHDVTLSGLTVADAGGTSTDYGGGIAVNGTSGNSAATHTTLNDVVLYNDMAGVEGGGFYQSWGSVTFTDCTVSTCRVGLGSSQSWGGGIFLTEVASLTMSGTLVVNNWAAANATADFPGAPENGSADGGGMYAELTGASTITNSTFYSNQASVMTGGASSASTGVTAAGAELLFTTLSITNSTFAYNTVTADPVDTNPNAANDGGLMLNTLYGSSTLDLRNTLVAQNTAAANTDMAAYAGVNITAQHNLIGDGTGSTLTNGVSGNLVGTTASPIDPKLTGYGPNGGPTYTLRIASDSPAVDAGTATGAPTVDQRGYGRDSYPDIGAYELNGANSHAPAFASTAVTAATVGQAYSYAFSATDPDGDAITFNSSTLPAGLTLVDNGDGTGSISGTPTAAGSGTITLTASDGTLTKDQAYTLTIAAATPAPTPTPTPVASSPVVLSGGVLTVTGTGGDDVIHVWSPKDRPDTLRAQYNGANYNFTRSVVNGVLVLAGAGNDSVTANGDLPATLHGGAGYDTLTGGTASDRLFGDDDADVLDLSYGGGDIAHGGSSDDLFYAKNGVYDRLFADGATTDRAYSDLPLDLMSNVRPLT